MTEPNEQPSDAIAALLGRAGELKAQLESNQLEKEGLAEVKDQYNAIRQEVSDLQAAENKRVAETEQKALLDDLRSMLAQTRVPSKATVIGGGAIRDNVGDPNFFAALAQARSRDSEVQAIGKARLEEMGSHWEAPHPDSKATLGDTDGAGGYLVPNNVVTAINMQAAPRRGVVDLFTVINGVRGTGVDIPWEDTVATRATIVAPGTTKDNVNFLVGNYTATIYTLARIFDVSNRLLRTSEGAAEQLVRAKLGTAMALGEDYYVIQGSGTSEPYGLLTALGTAGPYFTSHTPSASTIAGNWATALAKMAAPIAQRGAEPNGAIVNSGDYWLNIASGADAAGFYVDPGSGGFSFNPSGQGVTGNGPWGIRIRHSPNMPSDSAVVGDFRAAQFFRADGYRVDVSSEAGDRWDKNLTGFRGEEDIAFDARPYVYTGYFQRTNNILP